MRTALATASVLWTTPAFALSGRVACDSQSMTICQDEFCFASFDAPSKPSIRIVLELDRKTYIVPDVAADPRPMRVVAVEQTEHHYRLKLTVELADHHTGNVEFIANTKADGRLDLSAASRVAYPATDARSAIVAVTAF